MEIHFISSLAPDDEDRLASVLMSAVCCLLDQCSIAYTLRIQTSGSKVLHHHHPLAESHPQPRPNASSGRQERGDALSIIRARP